MPLSPQDKIKYKALYLQTAQPYVHQLQENIKALQNDQEDIEKITLMHRLAHSLSSQSTMIGYPQLGTLANLIEKIFKGKLNNTIDLSKELLIVLNTDIQKMQTSLEEIEKVDKELDLTHEMNELRTLVKFPS